MNALPMDQGQAVTGWPDCRCAGTSTGPWALQSVEADDTPP